MKKKSSKRTRKNVPEGFDSWLEYDLFQVLKKCQYHPSRIPYEVTINRTYEPDFIFGDTLIEAKGRFRTRDEANKYLHIQRTLLFQELAFVFPKPYTAMPGSRKRADGSRMTMADWADKHFFKWYTPETVPKEWKR